MTVEDSSASKTIFAPSQECSDIDMNKTWPTMLKMHPNDSGHTLNRSLKLGVESQRKKNWTALMHLYRMIKRKL